MTKGGGGGGARPNSARAEETNARLRDRLLHSEADLELVSSFENFSRDTAAPVENEEFKDIRSGTEATEC